MGPGNPKDLDQGASSLKVNDIPGLITMFEEIVSKSQQMPWISPAEVQKVNEILTKYQMTEFPSDVVLLNSLREDFYEVYKEYQDRLRVLEKNTPTWERARKARDLYFKFLNIPTLFLIGSRNNDFDIRKNAELSEGT